MTFIHNDVRRGAYLDSVALMRIARAVQDMDGVTVAGLMIGTPANLEILRDANVLTNAGAAAGPGDILIAVRATSEAQGLAAMVEARRLMDQPRRHTAGPNAWAPRTLRSAIIEAPTANLALISVPGVYAIAEARKALHAGLHAMIFSDNITVDDEAELKREARDLGLLVMGPDCGTAIIGGTPLAFANVVARGPIGIIGASGTGIQEISCLITHAGHGVSHAIGTGGRDLKAEVGGITTLMAIDMFDADPGTTHIVIVSKPPSAEVAARVLARVGQSAKPFTICFLADGARAMPANARAVTTLAAAAQAACHLPEQSLKYQGLLQRPGQQMGQRLGVARGLFAGGTLAVEAQIVFAARGLSVMSNAAIPGASALGDLSANHSMIDLGADEYTRGRPHPMIEPAVRDDALAAALCDRNVAVILLDCVLGYGGHLDPAGHLAERLKGRATDGPTIIASVTGTDADPQNRSAQAAKLEAVGVFVAPSNAAAASIATDVVHRGA